MTLAVRISAEQFSYSLFFLFYQETLYPKKAFVFLCVKKKSDPFVGLRMRMLEIAVNSCLKRSDARRFGNKLTWSVDEETSPFLTVKLSWVHSKK